MEFNYIIAFYGDGQMHTNKIWAEKSFCFFVSSGKVSSSIISKKLNTRIQTLKLYHFQRDTL